MVNNNRKNFTIEMFMLDLTKPIFPPTFPQDINLFFNRDRCPHIVAYKNTV